MRKLFLAAAAVIAASPMIVAAQSTGTTVGGVGVTSIQIPLSGVLAKRCSISAFLNGPFDALNVESLAVQGAESLSVNCNYGGSATVTFTSAGAGNLVSGTNSVPYKFILSGSSLSGGVSLATPATFAGFPATANANQTRSMSVQLTSIATIAGTYTDTITAAVTPN